MTNAHTHDDKNAKDDVSLTPKENAAIHGTKPRFTELEGPGSFESALIDLGQQIDTLRALIWKLIGEQVRKAAKK